MDEEEAVGILIGKIMELRAQGKTDSEIRKTLKSDEIPVETIDTMLMGIDQHIASHREGLRRRTTLNTAGLQALCVVVCAVSTWIFINFMQMNENLVPLNLFGINIVDTIVATGLGSLALSAFGTFFLLFGRYSD